MKITHTIIALIAPAVIGFGQDLHFSQPETSPLTLNPALAGVRSPFQAVANYRSQWNAVGSPYKTIAASFDGRLNENKRNKSGLLVAGIQFSNDHSGNLKVAATNASFSIGYQLIMNDKSTIGLALNTGFGQRSFDSRTGKWGSQYDGEHYNPSLPSGETFTNASFTFFDAGTGVVYSYSEKRRGSEGSSFHAGLAAYHLNRPVYSFLNNEQERLQARVTAFADATIIQRSSDWSVVPGIYYQRQGKAQELLAGVSLKYTVIKGSQITGFNKNTCLSLGAFLRNRDAAVIRFGLDWSDLSLGMAYDVNVSSLRAVSDTKGGFELFLRYRLTNDYLWK